MNIIIKGRALVKGDVKAEAVVTRMPLSFTYFNAETGANSWRHIVSAGVSPVAVEGSYEGRFFYVLSEVSEELRVFSVDPVTALPLQLQIVSTGLRPTRMVRRTQIQ